MSTSGGDFNQNPFGQNPTPYGQPPSGQPPFGQAPLGPGQQPMANNPYATPQSYGPTTTGKSGNGFAIASLVLGLLGMVMWLCPIVGLAVTIPGIVLGIKGLKSEGHGMAVAGLIASSIFLFLSLVNAALGAYMAMSGNNPFLN